MGNSSTDTCCLTLPLKLEKWQEDRLAKRFELARQIYNTLVRAELKKLERVKHSAPYREIQGQIQALDRNNPNDKGALRRLDQARDALIKRSGFRERTFKSEIKYYYKHFQDNIGSDVAFHGIAPQVWTAFDKVLFNGGKKVHYKRYGDVSSVQGYSKTGKSGGTEIMFRGTYIEWKGLKRKAVTAIRWAAWILVLCLLLTQLTGNAPGDLATLGQFVIAGLLYAISVVLEQKYKW